MALLGLLGVGVTFLLCMIILEKLVKRGGGQVGIGDACHCDGSGMLFVAEGVKLR